MKRRYWIMIIILFIIFSMIIINAEVPNQADNQIDFTYPQSSFNNATAYVNNSQYLQGLTPQQVANLFTELDPKWTANYTAYNSSWSSTTNTSYVPYVGATTTVNLGTNSLTCTGVGTFNNVTIAGNGATASGLTLTGKVAQTGITGVAGAVGSANTLLAGDGGASTTANTQTGGATSITSGTGGARTQSSTGNINGALGGANTIRAGASGAVSNTNTGASAHATGGLGGTLTLSGGAGATATIPVNANAGARATGGGAGGVSVLGGAGGSATGSTTGRNIGGIGGSFGMVSGDGGTASGATGTAVENTGGQGGNFILTGGQGGTAVGTSGQSATGGNGGSASFRAGAGAMAYGGTTNIGGLAGSLDFYGGGGGLGTTTSQVGGDVGFWAGSGGLGTSAQSGDFIFHNYVETNLIKINGDDTGDMNLLLDNQKLTFGAGAGGDAVCSFDGNSFNIKANSVTATDTIELQSNTTITSGSNIYPLADNTSSLGSSLLRWMKGWFWDLNVSNNLDVGGNITGNSYYGEMYCKNDTGCGVIDLVTADVYVQMFNQTAGSMNGFSLTGAGNLTAVIGGMYHVNAKVGITAGSPAGEYGMKVFVDETGQNNCYDHFHVGSDQISMVISCFVRLTAGQNISVRFDDHASPVTDLTFYSSNINTVRIGN